jgi:hypothetical protein
MTLAEIKSRHALRKITDAPLVKILGPDQSAKDMDAVLELVDTQKDLLRDLGAYLRNHVQVNDDTYSELLERVTQAVE